MSTRLFSKMVALAGCVETELGAIDVSNCRLIVTAAESVDLSADAADGDTAWVGLGRSEPIVLLEEGQSTSCKAGYRHTLVVGHVTCYPIEIDPLSDQVMLGVTEKQLDVQLALRKAITCCSWVGPNDVFDVLSWTPFFEGGIVGGQWELTLDG